MHKAQQRTQGTDVRSDTPVQHRLPDTEVPDDHHSSQGVEEVLRREKAYLTTLHMQERGDGGELLQVQQFLSGVEQRATELLTKATTVTLTPEEERWG